MASKNYEIGRRFEYRVQNFFRKSEKMYHEALFRHLFVLFDNEFLTKIKINSEQVTIQISDLASHR